VQNKRGDEERQSMIERGGVQNKRGDRETMIERGGAEQEG
jgi:hypothetical protein